MILPDPQVAEWAIVTGSGHLVAAAATIEEARTLAAKLGKRLARPLRILPVPACGDLTD